MEAVPYLLYRSPKSSCTLTNGVSPYSVPAVIQERRIVRIMRAHRRISAQRGLEIRGLNRERRKWAGIHYEGKSNF